MKLNGLVCRRCGESLVSPEKCTWLELDGRSHTYYEEGIVPEEKSQWFFEFGKACAKTVLKNLGILDKRYGKKI